MSEKSYRINYVNEDSWKSAVCEILNTTDERPLYEAVLAVHRAYYRGKDELEGKLAALNELATAQFGEHWFEEGIQRSWGDSQNFVADIYASGQHHNGTRVLQGFQLIA